MYKPVTIGMILWKRPCLKDKYLAKDLEADRVGDGKIAPARDLDTPRMIKLGD